MSGAAAGAAAAAAAAQIAMAVKASGTIVTVEPEAFLAVLGRQKEPLVVHATTRLARKRYHYLVSYKGLAFVTKSATALVLPKGAEVVLADKIWVP